MKKILSMGIILTVLTTAMTAFAGNKAATFSVSPVIGGITFEGNQHLKTSPVFGARAGYNFTRSLGIEALFDYARTESTISKSTLDMYRYGGELLYHFWPDNRFVPYLAAGYAAMNMKGNNPYPGTLKTKGVIDYGLGFKYFVTDNIAWRGDVRGLTYYYVRNDQHAIEYTTGVYIPFGGAPAVARLADPPPAPAPEPQPVAKPVAMPPPPPTVTLSAAPASVMKGQPSTLAWNSRNAANCEMQPGGGPVSLEGSMTVMPDNSTSYTVTCAGTGGVSKSTALVTVLTPVPPPPPPPPPPPSAAAQRFCNKPAILDIKFDTDKWDIKPMYHKELQTVGDFLKEFPASHGEISGHTDNTHTRAYNQKLSERRAESVKEYIVTNFGIAPERITTKGYNFSRPVASNKTKEGRGINRRIEANFVCE